MEKYDLCVIGAGPSGYAAAMRAIDFNKKVLMIEKKKVGGAGIWNGALSSKTWWELSRETAIVRKHLKQHRQDVLEEDFREIVNEVKNAENERSTMLKKQMTLLNSSEFPDLFSFVEGEAKIVDEHEVQIDIKEGQSYTIEADNIILATGSRPRLLPSIPVDEKIILTSDGVGSLEDFPKSMVILGAGVIGCEYATIFSNFGQTEVHLIDKGDRILPFEDIDVVNMIEENLEENDVLIHRNSRLVRMEIVDDAVEYELEYDDGRLEIFTVEKALISVGRVPNMENIWTDNVKIQRGERGILDLDTRTSVPHIYAVGDLTADIALLNVGELEGRHAVEKIFGNPDREMIYENVSTIMFLNPEVAGVGLNEIQAKAKGIDYKMVSLDYSCIPRAVARRNTNGFMKLIVTNDDEMKILGMRVIGEEASSSIEAVALLISMNKGIGELAELIHPHPSITEGIQECARILLGKSMFKPKVMKGHLIHRSYTNGEYADIN